MTISRGRVHVVIGDTQVKPGVPTQHLSWIGQYIVEKFPDRFAPSDVTIVHLGDHADMPSLSSYDKGKKAMEGRRYAADIEAANNGFDLLNEPLHRFNKKRRRPWLCERKLILGNHENRITVATENDAQLDGVLSLEHLNFKSWGWHVHDFLEPVTVDGVTYAHYFYNPNTGKPYGGENIETRLKTIGHSFTMGHQQGRKYGMRPVGDMYHHGLVLGSTYLHSEHYRGPQARNEWRGIAVCYQVERGSYDVKFVSLESLCRRYQKCTLPQYLSRAA